MRHPRTTTLLALLGLALAMPGCADSRDDPGAKPGVREDGGINIQAPGIDVTIDTEGAQLDVDTDGDGNTRSN